MARIRYLLLLVTLTWVCSVSAETARGQQSDLQSLLANPPTAPYKWFASTDPKGKNKDYLVLKPGETRRIPLAAGRLERLWCTAEFPDKVVVSLTDGNHTVFHRGPTELLRNGRAQHGQYYQKAYVLYPAKHTTLSPALYDKAALIATNGTKGTCKFFYQVTIRPQQATKPKPSVSAPGITNVTKSKSLSPGEQWPFFEGKESAIINRIEISLNPATLEAWRNVRLMARWGSGADAINVPLLTFTGQFLNAQPVNNALGSFDGKKLTILCPLPVSQGQAAQGTLRLLNQTDKPIQAVVKVRSQIVDGPGSPYSFCAAYGSARTQRGQPVQMLKTDGAGLFIGLALGIEPAPESGRRAFAYLEGNEVITADDKIYEGTGTEDYFNSAWYFPEKPFAQPYHGMTFKNNLPPQVSMYRLMIPDAVPFQKTLNVAMEHGSSNSSNDLFYRWAVFWYQKPPFTYQVPDTLAATASVAQATSGTSEDTSENNGKLIGLIFGILGVVAGVLIIRNRAKT